MRLPSLYLVALLTASAACAQDLPPGPAPAGDPPSRVARLNFIDGNVSFQPAGVDDWTAASINYPLTSGDHIYSDVASHAEMHIGPNALRLAPRSNFGFLNLDDRTVQVRFTEGAVEIRLRRLDDDDLYEVDTPHGAVSLLRTGEYRIETYPDLNGTMVTVRVGEVEVTANGNSFAVHPRQTAYFADGAQPEIRDANPPDAFDAFTDQRNILEDRIPPPVHVPPTMAGYQDLDAYGDWRQTPQYGWVWAPRVRAGWAPYHEGHWAWVEPWGWTWIDDQPWGFAPFHYGRWAYLGGVWVWAPGRVVARPVYAPALVAFVGGPRFGVAFGVGGGVGWFPLGPAEPYYPAYRVSNVYVQQVNITHVNVTTVNVTNVRYVNQQVPGAVVAVPQSGFASARPVAGMARPVSAEELRTAQVTGSASVAPQRESVLGNARPGNAPVARPSQTAMQRQVVAKTAPPPPPVSFAAKQQMLQANGGRPLAPEQIQQIRAQQPAAVNRAPVRMNNAPAPAAQNPVNRLDSRPPSAPRPAAPANPMTPANPAPAPRPQEVSRPPAPAENRPAPKSEKKPAKPKKGEKEEKK